MGVGDELKNAKDDLVGGAKAKLGESLDRQELERDGERQRDEAWGRQADEVGQEPGRVAAADPSSMPTPGGQPSREADE